MLIDRGAYSIGLNQDVFENMKNIEKHSANDDIYVDKHFNLLEGDLQQNQLAKNISIGQDGVILIEHKHKDC